VVKIFCSRFSVHDVALNLLQKIFTTHPLVEQELVERLSA
jgi:electron transfer flavoprotein beta subunit